MTILERFGDFSTAMPRSRLPCWWRQPVTRELALWSCPCVIMQRDAPPTMWPMWKVGMSKPVTADAVSAAR